MNDGFGNDVFHILGTDSNLDSILNIQTMDSRLMDINDQQLVNDMYDSLIKAHSNFRE